MTLRAPDISSRDKAAFVACVLAAKPQQVIGRPIAFQLRAKMADRARWRRFGG